MKKGRFRPLRVKGGVRVKRKVERDGRIRNEMRELIDKGYTVKESAIVVAEKYLLAERTVINIWYGE